MKSSPSADSHTGALQVRVHRYRLDSQLLVQHRRTRVSSFNRIGPHEGNEVTHDHRYCRRVVQARRFDVANEFPRGAVIFVRPSNARHELA